MVPLGHPLPGFLLEGPPGTWHQLRPVPGKVTVVAFLSNHCPYVHHLLGTLGPVLNQLHAQGALVYAVGANDATSYPQDGPEPMAQLAQQQGWSFPYVHDPTQDVARAFGATCTPDFFVYDAEGRLVYRGQFDATRPGRGTPTGVDLRSAVTAALDGHAPDPAQHPSVGCNIKWAKGSGPAGFSLL